MVRISFLTSRRFLMVAVAIASTVLYACSSTSEGAPPAAVTGDAALTPSDDAGDDPLDAGAPTACTLPRDGKTGVKKCDDCLLKSCCAVIRQCIDDVDCQNLTDCYGDCADKYPRTSDA